MSKANEKTPAPQTEAPTGGTDLAVVQPTQTVKDQRQDHGRGGLFTVINGVRQRIAGTKSQFEKDEK